MKSLTACRHCSGPLRTILELEPTPPANALETQSEVGHGVAWIEYPTYPLTLAQCETCRHVQLREVLPPELLFTADYPYSSGTSPVFRAHLERLARDTQRRLFPDDLVVEIGSNDGTLLRCFDPGLRVLGVDPAGDLSAAVTAMGILTYPGFFGQATAKAIVRSSGKAAAIFALNVTAHIDDLHSVAEGVRTLLAETGVLIVEVGYLPDVVRTNNFPALYHEHLDVWHLGPLIKFWSDHGMTLYDAERIDTQGGSIRYYVGKGRRASTDRLHDLLRAEESLPAALAEWPERVAASRQSIGDAIKGLKEAGHSICGYGASAKSTTLLHACGLGRAQIDFICDLAPSKIGKFTPGTHVAIVAPSELEKRKPDYCICLSGNFAESIRSQHPGYSGKWVELLPEVRVIE